MGHSAGIEDVEGAGVGGGAVLCLGHSAGGEADVEVDASATGTSSTGGTCPAAAGIGMVSGVSMRFAHSAPHATLPHRATPSQQQGGAHVGIDDQIRPCFSPTDRTRHDAHSTRSCTCTCTRRATSVCANGRTQPT